MIAAGSQQNQGQGQTQQPNDELRTQFAKLTGRVYTLNELADDIYDRLFGSPPKQAPLPASGTVEPLPMPHLQLSSSRIAIELDKLSTVLEAIRNRL